LKKNKKNKPRVQDIAAIINTSASTVSRALNNHPKISQQTKEKVWDAAKKLGYQPNIPAYMSQDKTKTICFMVPDLNSIFYRDAILSIQEFYKTKGYNLYIAFTNNTLDVEKTYSNSLIDLNIEGIIVAIFDKSADTEHLSQFINQKIPLVFINKSNHTPSSCKIIPDISHGAYKAVSHFISMKCKDIALFTANLNSSFFADIVNGYTEAMQEAGLKINTESVNSATINQEEIDKRLDNLVKKSKLPDAILATSANVSNLIMNWLNKKNMNAPNDILLVSFNNDKSLSVGASTLSSVQFSGSEIGDLAAKKLYEQINKDIIIDETIIIPAKFIIKSSSLKLK
jgi:LacI family transcriptional regulator